MAASYADAVGFLVRYLIRNAMGMATNSVRPANQAHPAGADNSEYATVLIMNDSGGLKFGATRRHVNYAYDDWSVGTAYEVGDKVTYGALAYECIDDVTGGAGPDADTDHWSETDQATQITETLDVPHSFTASVQFFRHATPAPDSAGIPPHGLSAFDKAARLCSILMLSPNIERMESLGLALHGASEARDVAAMTDALWEDRGSVDLYMSCATEESVLLETFASAEIALKSEWPGGRIETQTIEVTS